MIAGLLESFQSSLNLIALFGLMLDAGGAILVLGPDMPTVSKLATALERRRMNHLYEKLEEEGRLTENVEPLNRLFNEMGGGKEYSWSPPED